MRNETTIAVTAPVERVWTILSDVRAWPDWAPTVSAVDGPPPPLRLGQRHTVTQPGLRPTAYTVDELVDGRSFAWSSGNALVRQRAEHLLTPTDGGCDVTLAFEMSGVLGGPMSALAGRKIRTYLDSEATSLRQRVERDG